MNQQEREEWEIERAMKVLGLFAILVTSFFSVLFIGLIIAELIKLWTYLFFAAFGVNW